MKRVIVGVVFCALVAGCKKYDEGLAFSLRSKKNRVVNTWHEEEILYDGKTVFFGDPPVLKLEKDGKFSLTGIRFYSQGTWSFESNKKKLSFKYPNNFTKSYEIKRLTEDELWLFERDPRGINILKKYKGLDD